MSTSVPVFFRKNSTKESPGLPGQAPPQRPPSAPGRCRRTRRPRKRFFFKKIDIKIRFLAIVVHLVNIVLQVGERERETQKLVSRQKMKRIFFVVDLSYIPGLRRRLGGCGSPAPKTGKSWEGNQLLDRLNCPSFSHNIFMGKIFAVDVY